MLIFSDFSITTTIAIPIFGMFKKLPQNRFGYVQIEPDFAGNQFGIEWDWLLAHVVQIEQAAIGKILSIAEVQRVGDVVTEVELVPNHRRSPKMSGRNVLRFTCPLV